MLKAKDLFKGNSLAVGFEYRRFEFGKKNFNGDNFIINNFCDHFIKIIL